MVQIPSFILKLLKYWPKRTKKRAKNKKNWQKEPCQLLKVLYSCLHPFNGEEGCEVGREGGEHQHLVGQHDDVGNHYHGQNDDEEGENDNDGDEV